MGGMRKQLKRLMQAVERVERRWLVDVTMEVKLLLLSWSKFVRLCG